MSNNEQVPNLEEENEKELKALAKKNMETWFGAVATANPDEVKKLHQKDGLFDPTMLGKIMIGQEGAREYHEHFLEKKPTGEVLNPENSTVKEIGDNAYIYQGKYKFTFGGNPNHAASADFTYIWKKDEDNNYKIAYHHSSVIQEDAERQKIIDSLKNEFQGEIQEEKFLQIDNETKLHIGKILVGNDLIRFSQLEDLDGSNPRKKHYSFNPEV